MGTTGALGMKESVDNGWIKMEQALIWQLRCNHYPPLPMSLLATCKKAIQYANEGRWNVRVRLPEGILAKGGYKTMPTWKVVESCHLDSFINGQDEDYEGE